MTTFSAMELIWKGFFAINIVLVQQTRVVDRLVEEWRVLEMMEYMHL